MEFLNEFIMPVVLGVCLCIGYIIKKWMKDADYKYIPAIVSLLGVFLSVWMNEWKINPEIILSGLISGLSSTGLHQLLKQFIENKSG